MSHSDHGGLSSQDVLWPYIALFCVIFFLNDVNPSVKSLVWVFPNLLKTSEEMLAYNAE